MASFGLRTPHAWLMAHSVTWPACANKRAPTHLQTEKVAFVGSEDEIIIIQSGERWQMTAWDIVGMTCVRHFILNISSMYRKRLLLYSPSLSLCACVLPTVVCETNQFSSIHSFISLLTESVSFAFFSGNSILRSFECFALVTHVPHLAYRLSIANTSEQHGQFLIHSTHFGIGEPVNASNTQWTNTTGTWQQ